MTSTDRLKQIARLVAAGLVGYLVVALLTTLGFSGWLDDADLYRGGALLQAQGALVALVSGLAGGAVAGLLGGTRPVLHALAVLPLLAADTIYVLFYFDGTAPFWFDLAASLGLMAATVAGGVAVARWRRGRAG